MDFGEVIRSRRTMMGMNQATLAAKTGVSRNTVAGWETGHSRPDLATVPALCAALGITPDAFFGTEKERTAEERRILNLFFSLEERDREVIIWQMEALRDRRAASRTEEKTATRPVTPMETTRTARMAEPVQTVTLFLNELGAAAGFGAALGEAQGEPMVLLRDSETERADEIITVCGNSMEPTFLDGERVLVQHTKEIRPGEIGIFLVDNEGYIKEYRKDGLHSHNPEYRTMTFREGQQVRCLGRVIGKLRPEQIPTKAQLMSMKE